MKLMKTFYLTTSRFLWAFYNGVIHLKWMSFGDLGEYFRREVRILAYMKAL